MTEQGEVTRSEASRAMSAAVLLFARRMVVTVLSAAANALAARWLGVRDFGDLSAALAVYYFLVAVGDFGFSLVLGRALAAEANDRAVVMRAAALLQSGLTVLLSAGAVAYGWLVWGPDLRFGVLLALAPALLLSGLSGFRQIFVVLHRVRTMASLDIGTAVLQTAATVTAAGVGAGPIGVGLAISAASALNSALGAVLASRLVGAARASRAAVLAVLRETAPLGVMSVLATAYFTVDVIVLGWIADAVDIGYYAAAVKVLSILVALPAIVMTTMLPAVTRTRASGDDDVTVPVWHLLASTVLPACLVMGVGAPAVVFLLYGAEYAPAASPLAVLALAGAVATLSNMVGTLLVAERRGVALAVQNLVFLAVNIGLNLVFVPRFGIVASAWATVVTEFFAVSAACILLRRRVPTRFASWVRVSVRPLVVAVVAVAVPALVLGRDSLVALMLGVVAFIALMTLARAWPAELVDLVRRRGATA